MPRTAHYGKSCNRCADRKVGCNGEYPCQRCIRTGHAPSCIPRIPRAKRSKRAASTPPNRLRSDLTSPRGVKALTPDFYEDRSYHSHSDSAPDLEHEGESPSFVGENATPSFLNTASRGSRLDLAQGVRPALGLLNTAGWHPFLPHYGPSEDHMSDLLPKHADILRYTQVYQNVIAPSYPFATEGNETDDLVCMFLERSAIRERGGIDEGAKKPTLLAAAQSSLLYAIMACGAQYCDQDLETRVHKSRLFAQSAFHFAQMANFLLRPQRNVVHAFLLLCVFLQGDGQADAAWALTGLTARLAQSIGLDRQHKVPGPDLPGGHKNDLWSLLVWQDCLLSLSFDRAPLAEVRGTAPSQADLTTTNLTYAQYVRQFSLLCRNLQQLDEESRVSTTAIAQFLVALDGTYNRLALPLRSKDHCATRQARIVYHVIRMHTAYCVTVACRPLLGRPASSDNAEMHKSLMQRIVDSVTSTMESFIDLRSLTVLPLRNWSINHAALSSAIVVEFLDDPAVREQLRPLQSNVIDILAHRHLGEDPNSAGVEFSMLSASHAKYLQALHSLRAERCNPQAVRPAVSRKVTDKLGNIIEFNGNFDLLPMDLSNFQDDAAYLQQLLPAELPLDGNATTFYGDPPYHAYFSDFNNFDWTLGFSGENAWMDPSYAELAV